MRIAIPSEGQMVSAHFGRCPEFTLVDVEDRQVKNRRTIKNPGHVPGFLPKFLKEQQADCIVSAGMGMRARELFAQEGIEVLLGVEGPVDEVVQRLCDGTLESGESLCQPGGGKGYGMDKTECTHGDTDHPHHHHHEGGCA